jgi:hypothetical protein
MSIWQEYVDAGMSLLCRVKRGQEAFSRDQEGEWNEYGLGQMEPLSATRSPFPRP